MKKLDFYEFAGILAPGIIVVYGFSKLYPQLVGLLQKNEIGVGDLGLLFILGYVAGHLLQAVGNGLEWIWWWPRGGMPTAWLPRNGGKFLSTAQREVFGSRLKERLRIEVPNDWAATYGPKSAKNEWHPVVRQVYTEVRKSGRSERLDIFLGNYGLMRGIASAMLVIIIVAGIAKHDGWRLYAALSVMAILALIRMERFGRHYARELFLQFISIRPEEVAPKKKEEGE